MGVISTNSHVCVHKLCSLCMCALAGIQFPGKTAWAEGEKDEKHCSQ